MCTRISVNIMHQKFFGWGVSLSSHSEAEGIAHLYTHSYSLFLVHTLTLPFLYTQRKRMRTYRDSVSDEDMTRELRGIRKRISVVVQVGLNKKVSVTWCQNPTNLNIFNNG